MEGQNKQIQNQGLKWKPRPTIGAATEIGKDAIELILKIQITLWGLKRTKDKLRADLKKYVGATFKWNVAFCIKRCRFMLKKKSRTVLFWATLFFFLLPPDMQQGKVGCFLPLSSLIPASRVPCRRLETPSTLMVRSQGRRALPASPLASQPGAVAGQQSPAPHALL